MTTYTRDEPLFAHANARQKGEAAGQVCLENTRQTHQDWPELAYRALTTYIIIKRGKEPWSGEQAVAFVLRQPGIDAPPTERAFGNLFSRAKKAGLIRHSTQTYRREKGHGTIQLCWESVTMSATTTNQQEPHE
jgi:hypothetical protein